jgi:ribosomal protein S21
MSDKIEVTPRASETQDRLIDRFMKKWRDSKMTEELRERSGFDKKSVVKRKKRAKAAFKRMKEAKLLE